MQTFNGLDLTIVLGVALLLWAVGTVSLATGRYYVFDANLTGEILKHVAPSGAQKINAEYTTAERLAIIKSLQTLRELKMHIQGVTVEGAYSNVGEISINEIQIMHNRAERAYRVISTLAGLHWSQQSAKNKMKIVGLRAHGSDLCSSAGLLQSGSSNDATGVLTSIVAIANIAPEAVA